MKQLDSPDDGTRMSAALALAQIGKDAKDSAGTLQKVFEKDPNPMVRHAAGLALFRILPEPPPALAKQMKAAADQIEMNIRQLRAMLPPKVPWDASQRQRLIDPKEQAVYQSLVDAHLLISTHASLGGPKAAGVCAVADHGPIFTHKNYSPALVPALVRGIHQAAYHDLGFC
jgi:hypothetical protein